MKKMIMLLVAATLFATLFTGNAFVSAASTPSTFPIVENFEGATIGTATNPLPPEGWIVDPAKASMSTNRYISVWGSSGAQGKGANILRAYSNANSSGVSAIKEFTISSGGLLNLSVDVSAGGQPGYDKRIRLSNGSTEGLSISYTWNNAANRIVLKNPDGTGTDVALSGESSGNWIHFDVKINLSDYSIEGLNSGYYDVSVNSGAAVRGQLHNSLKNLDRVEFYSGDISTLAKALHVDNLTLNFQPFARVTASEFKKWKGVTWSTDKYLLSDGTYAANGIQSDIEDMKYADVGWIRMGVSPNSNLEGIDQKVLAARNAGINIVMCYSKGAPAKSYGTVEQETANANFLKSVVARYKNVIHHWEIHNEPNGSDYWEISKKSNNEAAYAQAVHNYTLHLQNSYNAIKYVDPAAVVILGGVSEYWSEDFITQLGVEGAYNYFDEVAYHPYAQNNAANPNTVIDRLNNGLKTPMASWPAPHNTKPIWITEVGFHTEQAWTTPGKVADEATKALYLTQSLNLLHQNLSVTRPVLWYTLHEVTNAKGYGLTQKSYSNGIVESTRLPAIETMRTLATEAIPGIFPIVENFEGFTVGTLGNFVPPEGWLIDPASMSNDRYISVWTSGGAQDNGANILRVYSNANNDGVSATKEFTIPENGGLVNLSFDVSAGGQPGYDKRIQLSNGSTEGLTILYTWNNAANRIVLKNPDGTGTDVALASESSTNWVHFDVTINLSEYRMEQLDPGYYDISVNNGAAVRGQLHNSLKSLNGIEFYSGDISTLAKALHIDNITLNFQPTNACEVSNVNLSPSGDAVNATLELSSMDHALKGTIIVAEYIQVGGTNVLNRIIDMEKDLIIDKGKTNVEVGISNPAGSAVYKVFYLDNMNSINPIMYMKEFQTNN